VNIVCVTEMASLAQSAHRSASLLTESDPLSGHRLAAIVRLQNWRSGSDPFDAERLAKEIVVDEATVTALFGSDVPIELAFEVAAMLEVDYPDVTSILVAEPSADLWRAAIRGGFKDIVDASQSGADLPFALQRTLGAQARQTAATAPAQSGQIIVVIAPKGGCGKTAVASNLGALLADSRPGSVAILDLDVQFGDIGCALGLAPERTITDLVQSPILDSTTLKLHLTSHSSGAYVLCGSDRPEDADAITDRHVTQIIKLMARDFATVVVDTPAGLDERTLAAVELATDLVFVSSLDVSSIRTLRRELDTLDRLGVVRPSRHMVLNRADSKVGLEASDVEAAIGMQIAFSIPSTRAIPAAMNVGNVVALTEPTSAAGRELRRLANSLNPDVEHPDAGNRRGLLRRRAS
jgi:pilus assembly protein CpaE